MVFANGFLIRRLVILKFQNSPNRSGKDRLKFFMPDYLISIKKSNQLANQPLSWTAKETWLISLQIHVKVLRLPMNADKGDIPGIGSGR